MCVHRAGYFLADVGQDLRSMVLNNDNAYALQGRSFIGSAPPSVLVLKAGQKLKFYISVKNSAGEQSREQVANPPEVTVLAQCGPVAGVELCSYYTNDGICATEAASVEAMRVRWFRPQDVGNGGSNVAIPITIYEVQVSPQGVWGSEHMRLINFTRTISHSYDAQGFGKVVGLTKGDTVVARVRAYTDVGAGKWSNASEPLKVVGYPSPPVVLLAKSGTSGEQFIEVDWLGPVDTGDLRNDTVPIIDYQIQFSNESSFDVRFTRSASLALESSPANYRWDNDNSGHELVLGDEFFTRVRARNVVGYSQFSPVTAVYFIGLASKPLNALATRRPLSINITWSEPQSRGAGPRRDGQVIPLLGYEIVVSMGRQMSGAPSENGQPLVLSENRTTYAHPDSGDVREFRNFDGLRKGMVYYVYIRALNTAFDYEGKGGWSDGAYRMHRCFRMYVLLYRCRSSD